MKKTMALCGAMLLNLVWSNNGIAAPQSGGKVERLYISDTGQVLFRLGATNKLPADCSDLNWPYEFKTTDVVGKEWLSLLLTVKAQGQSINIGYIPQTGSSRCKVAYLFQ